MLLLLSALAVAVFSGPKLYGIVSGRIDDDQTTASQSIRDWTIVQGPEHRPAIVMLTDGGTKVNGFQSQSVEEKTVYTRQHNYTLICCRTLLDRYRSPTWSKLKLLYKVLTETNHELAFWLDVDTIIWDRTREIQLSAPYSIMSQLDLHRELDSSYINAGVLVLRKTDWMLQMLKEAYRQYQIPLFQGLFYFDADQDALNLVMSKSSVLESYLDLRMYGDMWSLFKHSETNPFVLHFPNCVNGRCLPEYMEYFRKAMAKE